MGRSARGATAIYVGRVAFAAAVTVAACSSAEHAPFISSAFVQGHPHDAGPDSKLLHIPPPDLPGDGAPGVCGRTVVPIVVERPNLYFILDASGSMGEPMKEAASHGIIPTRLTAARDAIHDLLMLIGHRVSYGAALFPGDPTSPTDICPPGAEVFATRPGDDARYAVAGKEGPVLTELRRTLDRRDPDGLTPTASSIASIKSNLLALKGKTYAILLTDGAPNCGPMPSCDADSCTLNLEGNCPEKPGVSCCDPANGNYDGTWCLDNNATIDALTDLRNNGVETFIIGMPGTEVYAGVLDRFAIAGGTQQATEPLFYPVSSTEDLATTLSKIGLSVAIDCNIPLAAPPPDAPNVNVYFDHDVVPLDEANGWTWTGDASIQITGSSCAQLQTGRVFEVQVVAGCPSVTR